MHSRDSAVTAPSLVLNSATDIVIPASPSLKAETPIAAFLLFPGSHPGPLERVLTVAARGGWDDRDQESQQVANPADVVGQHPHHVVRLDRRHLGRLIEAGIVIGHQ